MLLGVVLFFAALSGCGGSTTVNSNTANANTANTTANNPLDTIKATPEVTVNDAPTLAPVFKAYCEAMARKDEAAIRKMYSQDTIKFFEQQMKEDKIKSLVTFLENDKVSPKLCEIRNEQINGDKATAEIRAESYPNGIRVEFVKENGEWKLTNRSTALDLKKSAPSSNAAAK